MKKCYTLTILLFTKLILFSQVTIDYTNPELGSSCNVFTSSSGDHSVTYQNLKHQTTFGYPYYSASEKAIVLESKPISQSQNGATQYAITFLLKKIILIK